MVDAIASWWDGHAERLEATLDELQNTILKSLDGLISQVKGMFGPYLLINVSSLTNDVIIRY